ncbi:thioesterase family protein [Aeromicrobium endophyticum]|uniref:Thioesterase family protein n=1 Tax=Aeromicrobium endophyticum TaxID=2292704 RepID=A0A371PD56_9ACTN|nr:thioesterase family protein [Aeromicrobium endophyticum]REK73875.1 thioesterase family protein [Aeromicrobium endophyticum]
MIPLDLTWTAFHGLQGGLVVAWLLEEAAAAAEPLGHVPMTISAHFLRAVDPAPADVAVEVVRGGRRTSSLTVGLRQDGALRAHGIVAGAPAGAATAWDDPVDLSGLPAPRDVPEFVPPRVFVPFGQHLEIRPVGGVLPGAGGPEPVYEAWIRLRDPGVATELGGRGCAAVLLDAMPPGLFGLWTEVRPVPTVELSAHLAPALDAPSDWWHVTHRTTWAGDGACVDETELRRPDGRLAAQARQLRLVL